jgi:ParB-like chromosome segregation protein Spo0J
MKKSPAVKTEAAPPAAPAAAEAMLIEMWPIGRPVPYARNARIVSPRAVDTVAASIKEFGWRQPIVVDVEDVIVVGHTRLMAAKKLGLTEVPVHIATTLTPAQCRAFRLMDNRSADETSWDLELVETEVMELNALQYDLAMTGFTKKEVDALIASAAAAAGGGLTEADAVPEVPETPVSIAGDLWLLGGEVTCPHCNTLQLAA